MEIKERYVESGKNRETVKYKRRINGGGGEIGGGRRGGEVGGKGK